jgi:hypothetical protein
MFSLHLIFRVLPAWRPVVVTTLSCVTLLGCGGGGGGGGSDDSAANVAGNTVTAATGTSSAAPESLEQAPASGGTSSFESTTPQTTALGVTALAYAQQVNTLAATPGDLIESFDNHTALSKWVFIPGGEFPGASGGLALAGTENLDANRHADLLANLGCYATSVILTPTTQCGKYVGANRNLPAVLPVDAVDTSRIQVRLKTVQSLLAPGFRLVDTSGQTLQYAMGANTLESVAGDTWATVSIPLRSPTSWWGGANNGRLQGGMKAVTLLVNQPSVVGPAGSLLIDEIRLVKTNVSELALTGQEPLITQGVLPSTDGRLSVNARYYKVSDASAKLAAEAGFKVARVDLFWETVEKNGRFDFSAFELTLNSLAKQGMKALFILDYGHTSYGGGTPLLPAQRAAFLEYVKQATRFAAGRNVIGFEVWNEPDNAGYWKNGDPVTYAELLAATRAAVKAIDPTRVVMNGGPSWFDLPYLLKLSKTGALNDLDAFAIHGYRAKMAAPESLATDLKRLNTVLSSNGVNAPVWLTETGVSSAGLATATYGNGADARARNWQARIVLRTLLTQIAMNLPFINLYELSDSGLDPNHEEHNFGLLTHNLSVKPSYSAIKLLHNLTKGRIYQGLLSGVPAQLHGMKWSGSGSSVYAVWADSSAITGKLTVPANAQVLSWDGNALPTAEGASGTKFVNVTLDGGPVYVVF